MLIQNLGVQTKSFMVFSEVAYFISYDMMQRASQSIDPEASWLIHDMETALSLPALGQL